MTVVSIYLIIGAMLGFGALKTALNALKDDNYNNDPALDQVRDLIDKIGLKTFIFAVLFLSSLFWAPWLIQRFFTNKYE